MLQRHTLGFIGGGNMGEALIKGLLATGTVSPQRINVYDILEERRVHLCQTYAVKPCQDIPELATASQVIIIAVKPQHVPDVLEAVAPNLRHLPLVISIAAGVSLSSLSTHLPKNLPIVRVMPNTPALVGEGASALARGSAVSDKQMQTALAIFRAVGSAIEVEEKWMDAVTGLSGSGPAYVLLFLESLVEAGVFMGLPRNVAHELAVRTLLGTAKMQIETGRHPAELKNMVTSPGGTTAHGLKALEQGGFRAAVLNAVQSATHRSQELGRKG